MLVSSLKGATPLVVLFLCYSLLGCATYQSKVSEARTLLSKRDYEKAQLSLKPLVAETNGDQLVFLLDYATTLQIAGKYSESNKFFLKADKLAEQLNYQSISRQTGSLLLSEDINQYKGDTFEKIFINAYLAMNYLCLGMLDDALIEARRINEKYVLYRQEEKKSFELNSFSKYLSALTWEANKNYDDAYIAYHEAYKIDPSINFIKQDLIRTAKLSQRIDSYNQWKKTFPEIKEDPAWYDKSKGELIIIFQQGWGPRKFEPYYNEYHLPDLMPVTSQTKKVRLSIEGQSLLDPHSHLIYDVQSAAVSTLKDDMSALLAKRIAARVAKITAANQIRKNNETLGSLSLIAMALADRADLRQWSFLPQSIQLIRIILPAGTYKFHLTGVDSQSIPTNESSENNTIAITKGTKSFFVWRSLN